MPGLRQDPEAATNDLGPGAITQPLGSVELERETVAAMVREQAGCLEDGWVGKGSLASAHLQNLKNAEAQALPSGLL